MFNRDGARFTGFCYHVLRNTKAIISRRFSSARKILIRIDSRRVSPGGPSRSRLEPLLHARRGALNQVPAGGLGNPTDPGVGEYPSRPSAMSLSSRNCICRPQGARASSHIRADGFRLNGRRCIIARASLQYVAMAYPCMVHAKVDADVTRAALHCLNRRDPRTEARSRLKHKPIRARIRRRGFADVRANGWCAPRCLVVELRRGELAALLLRSRWEHPAVLANRSPCGANLMACARSLVADFHGEGEHTKFSQNDGDQ